MGKITMPRLSDSMEEGTILSWLKQVGDEVEIGDEIVEIETDKANMGYESDLAGTLTQILAQEGDTVAVGVPIAVIGDGELVESGSRTAAAPAALVADEPARDPTGGCPPVQAPSTVAAAGLTRERVKASPLARRIAKEREIDLAAIVGSGPGGRIVKRDIEATAAAAPARAVATGAPADAVTAKGAVAVEGLSRLQQIIVRRMAESKATVPHFYLEAEVDMGRAVEARERLKAAAGDGEVVPSFNDMVVKACALALREFPRANGAYRDGRFELYSRVNVGVAVAAQDSLVVPTVFDADKKGLRQIAIESRQLAARVRDGQITPPELSGGTFTVSNLGMFGITRFSAVINSAQAGILAVGAIEERPAVRDGEIVPAWLMGVTLACDHRILYGADGARFLARVKGLLEEPLELAL